MKNFGLKRLAFVVVTAVVLGMGLFAAEVSAQNARVFQIQVPFDFVVMGRTFPADTYKIGRLSTSDPDALVLNTVTGKTLLVMRTQRLSSGEPIEFSKLSFNRHGKTYFLDSIRASGDSYESRIPSIRSDRERRDLLAKAQLVSITTQ